MANPQQGEESDVASAEGTADEATPAGIVEEVLAANDHYAVLSVARSAERGQLCRAYIETAAKVHPAASPHPDAERAFLRATLAWAELRCEEARREYDAHLQKGIILVKCEPERPDNADEARQIFAEAWHECVVGEVGSNMTEFAQVLSRAQQLVTAKAVHPASKPLQAAASGLAVSVGLWAAGAVATASGFGTIGSLARRAALVQGAGQVAMGGIAAYQHPEMREALDSGVAAVAGPARACASGAKAAARSCAGALGATCQTPFSLDGIWSHLPTSCLPLPKSSDTRRGRDASRDDSESLGSTDDAHLKKGDMVYVGGLRSAVDLNGREGVVTGFDVKSGRYQVHVLPNSPDARAAEGDDVDPKDVKLIRRENLERARRRAPATAQEFI